MFWNTYIFKAIKLLESATIWYTDHQYLAQYSEIISNRDCPEGTFCDTVQIPSSVGDMELI